MHEGEDVLVGNMVHTYLPILLLIQFLQFVEHILCFLELDPEFDVADGGAGSGGVVYDLDFVGGWWLNRLAMHQIVSGFILIIFGIHGLNRIDRID